MNPLCVSTGRYVIKHIRSHFGSSVSGQSPLAEPPAVKFPTKGSQTTKPQSKQLINQTINNQLFILRNNCGVVMANLRCQRHQRQTLQRACWLELASPLQPHVWWQRASFNTSLLYCCCWVKYYDLISFVLDCACRVL